MKCYFPLLLSIVSSFSIASTTQEEETHIYHYDLMSEAVNVGDVTIQVVEQADGGYVVAESTSIETPGWLGDISSNSNQIESYSSDGDFLKADVKTLSGNQAFWSKAEISGDELWASYTQVENLTEKEEGEFIGAAAAIASNMVAGLGSVLAITQLFLSDADAPLNNVRMSTSTYETSFANLPFYWMGNQYKLPAVLSLFDSGTLAVNTFDTQYLGAQTFQLDSKEGAVVTSHYKLTTEDGPGLEIWLAVSERKSPYFYQLTGADSDGPFQVLLTQE
jgi:hypothetical protein